jgi:hypothetical protein
MMNIFSSRFYIWVGGHFLLVSLLLLLILDAHTHILSKNRKNFCTTWFLGDFEL